MPKFWHNTYFFGKLFDFFDINDKMIVGKKKTCRIFDIVLRILDKEAS